MPAPILPVSSTTIADTIRPAGESSGSGGFKDVFSSAVNQVESMGQEASASVERFLSGEGEELHTTVLATQRAELAFEMFLQARNKVVSAYQEIMRMQV
jgi:flagellar hook-basal body complex protein FliE